MPLAGRPLWQRMVLVLMLRYWHCIGGGTIRHHWPEANTSIARIERSRRLWMRIGVINLNKVAAGLEDCRHNPHIPRSAGGRRWIKIFPLRPINWINLKTYGIFHICLIQLTSPSMTKFNEERFLDRNVHLKAIWGPKLEQLHWVYNLSNVLRPKYEKVAKSLRKTTLD